MNAAAFFGNLNGCCDGMKMERQEENKQQDSRADETPQAFGVLHTWYEHGLKPK
jgi:hypothetical protein